MSGGGTDGRVDALKRRADAIVADGIATRERYLEALPLMFGLRSEAESLSARARALAEAASAIGEGAAEYAAGHATALDAPLAETKDGIMSGTVEVGGATFRLTVSPDSPKRIDGGSLTQAFLKGLPKEWTKGRLEIAVSALRGKSAEELAEHRIMRGTKRVWSLAKGADVQSS
jgi:hypothetical protein